MAGGSLLFILSVVYFLILPHSEQALGINCFHSAKSLEHLWFSPLGGCDEKRGCLYIFLFIILRSYHSVTPNLSYLGFKKQHGIHLGSVRDKHSGSAKPVL